MARVTTAGAFPRSARLVVLVTAATPNISRVTMPPLNAASVSALGLSAPIIDLCVSVVPAAVTPARMVSVCGA